MEFQKTIIPGCFIIVPDIKKDERGVFIKTFHAPTFKAEGINVEWKESFYTRSQKNVLRGLHFQAPPSDHHKLVYCVKGEIFDVAMDLRKNSPSFGKSVSVSMNEENGHQLFIPKGLAHGFLTLSDDAIVVYSTSHPYAPEQDLGILWKSADIIWPSNHPVISERDKAFPAFSDFKSPFEYTAS